ncbi:MAG: hypothetical protein HC920_00600 [Oscillatoriales cyanobacterium SM2_3_0]|nr:hypothetical protein [Oscillatoriales cyanobacterium SM2_3_0]
MAILATINFGLVLFNVSYIPLRDFYFRYWPELTRWYDPIKGIEPNRETTAYLETVERLQQQVSATGLESPEAETILASLGNQSIDLINEDPFALANKSGSLEKIKNRMQDRISIPPKGSAKEAFTEFWSQDYLLAQGFNSELNWFETQISPAIASNYYRGIGENGEFIGGFWRIDLPFMVIFLLEYLGRTYLISRRFTRFTWRDALIWRWYDVFLFVPIWRWLRIIPVAIRLDQSALLDLERVRLQAIRNVIASFAQELTEVVVVQFINQVQAELKNGNLMKQVFEAQNRRYIDLNNTNELETIATHLVQTTVFQVIPQLKPDIEALLRYSLESSLKQMPLYESMQRIPGLQTLPQQMVERLVSEFSQLAIDSPQKTYESVRAAAEDSKGVQLSNRLVRHFGELLGQELREKETLNEIESLLIDFLEEFKLNYIQRVDFDDFQQTLAEHQQLKRLTPRS